MDLGGNTAPPHRLHVVPVVPSSRRSRWRTLGYLLYIQLTMTVGLMLIWLPWLPWWDQNYFAGQTELWSSSYLRGAVSGLGLVNVVISLGESIGLYRKRRH